MKKKAIKVKENGLNDKNVTTAAYWDKRAKREYIYKKEKFYTITPIPYYFRHRKIILDKIQSFIMNNKSKVVCDFGCGDGEYISQFYRRDWNSMEWILLLK